MVKPASPKSSLSTGRQMLAALGVRDRIVFPFSPRKVVAALHDLADLRSSPRRVEHPLLRLNRVMAVLWLADVRHFLALERPITGSRYQAYPEGPVPVDVLAPPRRDIGAILPLPLREVLSGQPRLARIACALLDQKTISTVASTRNEI
jgi:hypothetical protein